MESYEIEQLVMQCSVKDNYIFNKIMKTEINMFKCYKMKKI